MAEVLPDQKAAVVKRLQAERWFVAGDHINARRRWRRLMSGSLRAPGGRGDAKRGGHAHQR
jgi:hypothetical protein